MKFIACLVTILLAASGDTDYSEAAKKIRLPDDPGTESQYGSQEWFQTVKKWMSDPKNWEQTMKTIEERTGLSVPKGIDTVVSWSDKLGDSPTAYGGTRGGRGTIQVAPRFLKSVPKNIWNTVMECTFAHEYTHVIQRTLAPQAAVGWPEWFREGMAIYAGGNAMMNNSILGYKPTDLVPLEQSDRRPHPRGTLMFAYMDKTYGAEKIKELVQLTIKESRPVEQSFAKVSGVSWEELQKAEHAWSREFLEKRYSKKPADPKKEEGKK